MKRCLHFALLAIVSSLGAAEFQFTHHFISRDLPTDMKGTGDYGLTALVDLDRDGDLDFVLGGRGVKPPRLYWFERRTGDNWVQHIVGTNYQSDVGIAPLDVDGDGWTDLVASGVWYRNTGRPATDAFERLTFATNAAGAHDILAADIDGDGRRDVVMMGDERTELKALVWFKIPADPRQPWERHLIGPAIHGAITPGGVADLDHDGDFDVVRADTWFENKDGHGRAWVPHANIPFGRVGPFGKCVRTAVVDLDGDGQAEVVMADADITDSRVVILRNEDGRGGSWAKAELPHSFTYGSLHALAVADLDGDGRPDIVANEQEELLPAGRENPRWVAWQNLGSGRFRENILLDQKLGGHELQVGDVDGDGDIDICSKPWGVRPWNGNNGRMHVDFLENNSRTADVARGPAKALSSAPTAPNELAALKAEIERLKGLVPDQSHAMKDVGYHFANLWFAAQKKNWPLAEFYAAETRAHLRWAVRIIPVRKDPQGNEIRLLEILDPIERTALKELQDIIKAGDGAKFPSAYKQMMDGCYSCHLLSGKPYLRLQIPAQPEAPIIQFDPAP